MGHKGDEVAQWIINRRGYLVVGFIGPEPSAKVGDRLTRWAHMDLSQPIVLTEETDRADWLEQGKQLTCRYLADQLVPRRITRWEHRDGDRYFRAMTD